MLRRLRGTPMAARLAQHLAAQQGADGNLTLAAFREALEAHGVLLSPQDYFSIAIGIDPGGAGARVRCSLVTRELHD